MNRDTPMDSDPLQNLLADAFAVQESGIRPDCLADLVHLEQSIEKNDFDLLDFMQRIAERARSVAQASGTAIGSIEADELVYQAVTGSAASYNGRRVIATLTSSTTQETTAEILRVEDADADPRLQASICRQFGARSLLILPIACDHELWGVLQIFFDQPHAFAEPEIRTYHLLLELLTSALSLPVESEQLVTASDEPLFAVREAIATSSTPFESPELPALNDTVLVPVASLLEPDNLHAGVPELRDPDLDHSEWVEPDPVASVTGLLNVPNVGYLRSDARRSSRACALLWRRAWDIAVAAVAVIAVAILFVRQDRLPTIGAPATPSTAVASGDQSSPAASVPSLAQPANSPLHEPDAKPDLVPVNSNFAHALPSRIHRFGNDVTVRYFTPTTPTIVRTNADHTEIRQLSDDVTIRYFNVSQSR
jgi:hypothetical protein